MNNETIYGGYEYIGGNSAVQTWQSFTVDSKYKFINIILHDTTDGDRYYTKLVPVSIIKRYSIATVMIIEGYNTNEGYFAWYNNGLGLYTLVAGTVLQAYGIY